MFETVVVPVDGSPQDETTTMVGARIARDCHSTLHYVRVHVTRTGPELATLPGLEEDVERLEEDYLSKVADGTRLQFGRIPVTKLLTGPIGESIADYAASCPSPLVVMSTHGRTGFSRLWLGSVADAVVRRSSAPVLLLRIGPRAAETKATEPPRFARIVVTLDGSEFAEHALEPAMALAALDHGCIHLVRVLEEIILPEYPFAYVTPRIESSEELEERKRLATEYMERIAKQLKSRGTVKDVSCEVRVEQNAAYAILEAAKSRSADLVAIATHGRGASRLLVGSVADKVLRGSGGAVLVVHPKMEARNTAKS